MGKHTVFCLQYAGLSRTVRLQKSDEEQFFYEVPVATPVPEATQQLVAIHNLRMRIKRSAQQRCMRSNGLPTRGALMPALQPASSMHTKISALLWPLGSSWRAASLCSMAQPSALTSKALTSMQSSLWSRKSSTRLTLQGAGRATVIDFCTLLTGLLSFTSMQTCVYRGP